MVFFLLSFVLDGAQNRTRTCTSSLTLVPETSASTNFAIWAFIRHKGSMVQMRIGLQALNLSTLSKRTTVTLTFTAGANVTKKSKKIQTKYLVLQKSIILLDDKNYEYSNKRNPVVDNAFLLGLHHLCPGILS